MTMGNIPEEIKEGMAFYTFRITFSFLKDAKERGVSVSNPDDMIIVARNAEEAIEEAKAHIEPDLPEGVHLLITNVKLRDLINVFPNLPFHNIGSVYADQDRPGTAQRLMEEMLSGDLHQEDGPEISNTEFEENPMGDATDEE